MKTLPLRNWLIRNLTIFFTKWIAFGDILLYNNNAFLCAFLYPLRKETVMIPWQVILVAAAVVMIIVALAQSSLRKNREYKKRDNTRKLELVLQPRESIKVICPQKKGRVILTSKRVLFETKGGFTAVPIKTIKKVQGNNEKGNRTTIPANMVSLTIKAEQDYAVKNDCEEFAEFAKQLMKKTAPKKKKVTEK